MSIHVVECRHGDRTEYHLRYPGMTKAEAQNLADRINTGWSGLTDEEIMDACSAVWASHPIEVGRVVEDKLKEKNT